MTEALRNEWIDLYPHCLIAILTHDIEVGELALHGVGVDLTHVVPGVSPPDVGDLQPPDVAVGLRDPDPVILGDDVFTHREHRLGVHPDPGDLMTRSQDDDDDLSGYFCYLEPLAVGDVTGERRVTTHHYTRIHHRGEELRVPGVLNIVQLSTFHQ